MRLCHKVQMIVMSLLKLSIIDLRNQYKIRVYCLKGKRDIANIINATESISERPKVSHTISRLTTYTELNIINNEAN